MSVIGKPSHVEGEPIPVEVPGGSIKTVEKEPVKEPSIEESVAAVLQESLEEIVSTKIAEPQPKKVEEAKSVHDALGKGESLVLGPDGKPIEGAEIIAGADDERKPVPIDKEGRPIIGATVLGPEGTPVDKGIAVLTPDGKALRDASLIPGVDEGKKPVPLKDDGLAVREGSIQGPDGNIIERGMAILGPDGKPVRDSYLVTGVDGKPVPVGPDQRPIADASILGSEGKLVERGTAVVGPTGKIIKDSSVQTGGDGAPVPIGGHGKPIPGAEILGPDSKTIQKGSPVLKPDGKPIPGSVIIKGADDRPVAIDTEGKPIQDAIVQEPGGRPLPKGAVVVDQEGKPVKDATVVKGVDLKPVPISAEGKPLKDVEIQTALGETADKGTMVPDSEGKPIKEAVLTYGPEGKPIVVGTDGKPLTGVTPQTPEGQPITKGPSVIGTDGKPIPGASVIIGVEGKPVPISEDGKPIPSAAIIAPDGKKIERGSVVLGPEGKAISGATLEKGADGKPIPVAPDGKLIRGSVIEGPDGETIKKGVAVIDKGGKPIKDALLIKGADGKPVPVTPDGTLIKKSPIIGPQDEVIEQGSVIVAGDGKPIIASSIVYGPDRKPVPVGPDAKPIPTKDIPIPQMLDSEGKKIEGLASITLPDGVRESAPSVEIGPYQKPIVVSSADKPIFGAKVIGADGKPIEQGPVIVSDDGKIVKGSSILVEPDGTIVPIGPEGKPLKESKILSPKGVPITEKYVVKDSEGVPIPEAKFIMGADGKPVGVAPDGRPIKGSVIQAPDGTKVERGSLLLGPDGKPLDAKKDGVSIAYSIYDGQPVIVAEGEQPVPGAVIQDGFGIPDVGPPSKVPEKPKKAIPEKPIETIKPIETVKPIEEVIKEAGKKEPCKPFVPGESVAECLCNTDPEIQIACLSSRLNETEEYLKEALEKLENINCVLEENDQLRMQLVSSELELKTLREQQELFHKRVACIPSELDRLEEMLCLEDLTPCEQICIYKKEIAHLKRCCVNVAQCVSENRTLRAQLDAIHDAESDQEDLMICDNLTCISDVSTLQEIVQSLRCTVKSLLPIREERDALDREVQRLHARLRDLDENYLCEVQDLKRRSQILDNVMGECEDLRAQLDRYEGMDDTIRLLIQRAQEADEIRDQLEQAKKCCEKCECSMQDMEEENENICRTMEKIAGERDILMHKLEDCRCMEDELDLLRCEAEDRERSRQHHIECLQLECDAYRDKLDEMCARDQELQSQIEMLQGRTEDCVALKNRLRDAELAISDQEEEINRLLAKIQKLAGDQVTEQKCVCTYSVRYRNRCLTALKYKSKCDRPN